MTPPDEAITRERERWFSDAEDNAYREEMHAGMERGDPRHDEFSAPPPSTSLGSLRPGERLELRPGEGLFVVRDDEEPPEADPDSEPEDG